MLNGKCSTFGGVGDSGMSPTEGLALYEDWEASLRPDLFYPFQDSPIKIPVWKRLKTASLYCAIRFPKGVARKTLQETPVKVINLNTKQFVMAWLVDFGPAEWTQRVIDLSPGVEKVLSLKTDMVVSVEVDYLD